MSWWLRWRHVTSRAIEMNAGEFSMSSRGSVACIASTPCVCFVRSGPRRGRWLYDEAVREALIVIWEASDRICGKRLRPLVPILVDAMERHGHLELAPALRVSLIAMSAATINRAALREARALGGGRKRRRSRHRLRSGAPFRCEPSMIVTIRRPASSKRISWRIAGRR
jgi:hypothetical protein